MKIHETMNSNACRAVCGCGGREGSLRFIYEAGWTRWFKSAVDELKEGKHKFIRTTRYSANAVTAAAESAR